MWQAIKYSPKYFAEMLEMTKEQYGEENDIANKDFIQHQYFNNPSGDAIIALAWDSKNDILAGQYLVAPMRFMYENSSLKCVNSLNTLTKKEYRGQKIFTGLAENVYSRAKDNDFVFCYGVPNPNSYPGFINKLHFHQVCAIPLFLRPMCPSAMIKEFIGSSLLSNIARPFDTVFHTKQAKNNDAYRIVPFTHDNLALADQFWKAVSGKYPIMNIRDQQFMRFRYLDMRRRKYYPFFILKGDVPVAWAVGRVMEVSGMQCGMLADFLFVEGEEIAANRLLSYMLWVLQENGASVAGSLMLKHTQEARLLKKKGFFQCPKKLEPQPFPLIVRAFDRQYEQKGLLEAENWFFTMGDYDVI